MRTSTTWRPGQSGNPRGRPPLRRTLNEALRREMARVVALPGGRRVARKRLLAELVSELVTTGRLRLPGGTVLECTLPEWAAIVRWLYDRLEGMPAREVDVTTGGNSLVTPRIEIEYVNDWRAHEPAEPAEPDAPGDQAT